MSLKADDAEVRELTREGMILTSDVQVKQIG